jgi:putative ABC transport system ATP-binding protein
MRDVLRNRRDHPGQNFRTAIIALTHDPKTISGFKRIDPARDGRTHEQAGEGREP